ncbi:hypothetical protein A1L58_16700 [Shewanella baltica]|nr:hypothetical protein A1L58_16700 [Shewanella baltica]
MPNSFLDIFELRVGAKMTDFRFEKYGMALNLWPIIIGHNKVHLNTSNQVAKFTMPLHIKPDIMSRKT